MDDVYERQKRYYDLRAQEYDLGAWEPETAVHATEVAALLAFVSSLPPARTLDVACGTGFLTQHLPGELTVLDASDEMLRIAAARVPAAGVVQAEALPLPFADGMFERVFSSHFYDHLKPAERRDFRSEARRVGDELILVQQNGGDVHREGLERRVLQDASAHDIYKVYFTADSLIEELGGGELLYRGDVFLVARRRWGDAG